MHGRVNGCLSCIERGMLLLCGLDASLLQAHKYLQI